ncbi:MAG: extracellular solute-binding protein [Micrococcales bacterium]|nr:extracellular solute-binding protein [Micrococcales bacterium]
MAAAVAAAAFLMAGCTNPGTGTSNPGGGATSGTTSGTTSGATASTWPDQTASLQGVTLTIWAAQTSTTEPASVVSAFEQATGATVNVVTIPDPYEQNVETKIATGDKPDLALWQPTAAQLTGINAATNLLTINDAPWLSSYKPGLKDMAGLLNDQRYAALITSPSVMGVFYNKKVFAANGITALPQNWDELVTDAKTLKAAGVTPFFEAGGDKWPTQFWVQTQLAEAAQSGLWDRINSGQEKFTDPTILGAIQEYQDLINQGMFNSNIASATFADQATALLNGTAAMAVNINALVAQMQTTADTATLNDTIGFFPISKSGTIATSVPDQTNGLVAFNTGNATQENAARQFMSFWMGQGYSGFVNAMNTVSLQTNVPDASGVPQVTLDLSSALANSVGSMQSLAVVNTDLYIYLANMIAGTMTPQQAAQASQDQFDQTAKAAGVPGF